jgi:hypothetical protein
VDQRNNRDGQLFQLAETAVEQLDIRVEADQVVKYGVKEQQIGAGAEARPSPRSTRASILSS